MRGSYRSISYANLSSSLSSKSRLEESDNTILPRVMQTSIELEQLEADAEALQTGKDVLQEVRAVTDID